MPERKSNPGEPSSVSKFFGDLANRTSLAAGRASTFILAAGVFIVWAVSGPLFGFSDTWQLVINTGTTIVTFLMVFFIENSQNRDSAAIQVKLDELIREVLHGIRWSASSTSPTMSWKISETNARQGRAAEKSGDETVEQTGKDARRAADRVVS